MFYRQILFIFITLFLMYFQMNCHGILKTDDLITRFFRLSTQMVVDLCYRYLPEVNGSAATTVRNKMFQTVDAYVKLISLLVKHSGDPTNMATKINLLNKVLGTFFRFTEIFFIITICLNFFPYF